MATLNPTTWQQAQAYVNNFFRTSDISGQGNTQIPVPANADQFVAVADVIFQQITKKHGGTPNAYHNHTGTAGGLLALLNRIRTDGNPPLARTLAEQIHNNGQGAGYVMTSQGRVQFKGTSGCTRSDLNNFVSGGSVFRGIWAGQQ